MNNYYDTYPDPDSTMRGGIIDKWLQRSNLHHTHHLQYQQHHGAHPMDPSLVPKQYDPKTSLEDLVLEGDVVLEPFLLNPEIDLAKQLEDYSESRLKEASTEQLPVFHTFTNILNEEKNLWNLVSAIYSDRAQREPDLGLGESEQVDPFQVTDYQLVQRLLAKSGRMSDATIVRSWLESTAPEFQPVSPRKGGWVSTKIGAISSSGSTPGSALTELDPDAPMRQQKKLDPDDEIYDNALLRSLFFYIRRGKIEQAISLAVSSDQSWRAASIRGGLYFRDPQLEIQDEVDDGMSSEFDNDDSNTVRGDDGSDMPAGNPNRYLWKCSCYAISKEIVGCKYERALYAVLCGDLENLLKACDSWEDYLWAYYTCLMDSRIEKFFRECGRTGEISGFPAPPLLELEEAEIFSKLEHSTNIEVFHRSQDIYSQIKKHIVLNTLDVLLKDLAATISHSGLGSQQSGIDFQVVRFLALLILYLRSIGLIDAHPDADIILQHYIFLLSEFGQHRLAILYCSKLPPDQQVEAYATLLSGINEPLQVRMECLRYGCMYGLNFDRVLLDAAEKSLAAAASKDVVEELDPRHFKPTVRCSAIPQSVHLQIRAFEWIDHDVAFYPDALMMCNQACHRFLRTGRLWAVCLLLEVMPPSLVSQDKLEEDMHGNPLPQHLIMAAQEYMNYAILVEAFTQLDMWRQTMQSKPSANESAFRPWEQDMKEISHIAEQALRYALNSNWMLNCFTDTSSEDPRIDDAKNQAKHLRQIYIPELAFALFEVLLETRDISPRNLHTAFGLSELFADESLGIYKEIMRRPDINGGTYSDLPKLLDLFKTTGILLLEMEEAEPTQDDFFPPILSL